VNGDSKKEEPLKPSSMESIMETNAKNIQTKQNQSHYAEPRVFLSKDGEYLVHALPGNILVKKHVNFYKKVLGVDFVPKTKSTAA
jgi:hypothetical protein